MDSGIYKDGDKTLELLIESLPNLMSLDISGTNLDGDGKFSNFNNFMSLYVFIVDLGTFNNCESLIGKQSDIPGLQRRVNNPLEFLGLYRTKHDACQRQNIPAKIVSNISINFSCLMCQCLFMFLFYRSVVMPTRSSS